ncbi:hypothetical protein Tco_0637862 [Tanacetum coccineum]
MQCTDISEQERHSRPMNEFDKFVAIDGESLTSVYDRFTTLINIMDQNNYIIAVAYHDELYDHLSQFEPHVKASKSKKAARNHDPLALVSNSHSHSSYSHASSSYTRSPQTYYVTHPSYVIDNDDDYQEEIQRDAQEDKLSTLMMLLARAITQRYSTPTNNPLRTSSNIRNQAMIQDGRVDIQSKNVGYAGNDEAGVHLDEEENDFMLDNDYEDDTLEEFISEVNASQIDMNNGLLSKSDHEQRHHEKLKTIIQTFADDQIYLDIIFDDPYVDCNSGQAEHDTNAHD